jgi:hypothetical protein
VSPRALLLAWVLFQGGCVVPLTVGALSAAVLYRRELPAVGIGLLLVALAVRFARADWRRYRAMPLDPW